MSVEVLLNTYGHHHPDHLRAADDAFGSRAAKKNVSVVESVVGRNAGRLKIQNLEKTWWRTQS